MKLPVITSQAELAERLADRRAALSEGAPSVEAILAQVRDDGDAALREISDIDEEVEPGTLYQWV